MQSTVRDRLLARIIIDDAGCWLWQGPLKAKGYATIWVDGASRWVHRVSYAEFVGPIPDGLQLDHLCRVHNCLNPEHLEPVTAAENTRRGLASRGFETHCRAGHEYTETSSYLNAYGRRQCRTCQARRQTEKYQRRAAQGLPQRKSSRAA